MKTKQIPPELNTVYSSFSRFFLSFLSKFLILYVCSIKQSNSHVAFPAPLHSGRPPITNCIVVLILEYVAVVASGRLQVTTLAIERPSRSSKQEIPPEVPSESIRVVEYKACGGVVIE